MLAGVLRNLLNNAMRHAKQGIQVTFRVLPGRYELIVADDGPGIPEEERERVFEPFVQLESTADKRRGFGLGLAIVKRALEWHGGAVEISHWAGGGTRVCAAWPVRPEPALDRVLL